MIFMRFLYMSSKKIIFRASNILSIVRYIKMLGMFIRNMASSSKSIKPPIRVFGVEGRYVNALYSAAYQLKQLDAVEKSLRDFRVELRKPKVLDFIATSLISRNNKAKLLADICKELGMPTATQNFLALVAENGRLKMLLRMINMFLTIMVAHRNEALCEVITAEPLDEKSREALMDVLRKFVKEGKKIQLTEKVDDSVIGGVVIGFEDKHIDMSIARRMNMYKDLLQQAV